jgi:hypothetical protein
MSQQWLAGSVYNKEPLFKLSPTRIHHLHTGRVWERIDSEMYENRIECYLVENASNPSILCEGDEEVETTWSILSNQCINKEDWIKPKDAPPEPYPAVNPPGYIGL